eukprot:TRINITY_DN26996_c0_g1_i3.p2 TRINITY_DN26996_c0_g1~~TRINITY_DN26996_c0_g1_i3.p2  ORF type:complete len:275 (+),score=71.45 TRINITY_DN26996_c0_g1_i3:38-862(+)
MGSMSQLFRNNSWLMALLGILVMVIMLTVSNSQHPTRLVLYVGVGVGSLGRKHGPELLRAMAIEFDQLAESDLAIALQTGQYSTVWVPGGNSRAMWEGLTAEGVRALHDFVAGGGGYIGFCGGAELAIKMGISGYVNMFDENQELGFGPVRLQLAEVSPLAAIAQGVGVGRQEVALHDFDYYSGPVLKLPTGQFAPGVTGPLQPLLWYATKLPKGAVVKGMVACGANTVRGMGRVLICGPHLDIDWSTQRAPNVSSVEFKLLRTSIAYIRHENP